MSRTSRSALALLAVTVSLLLPGAASPALAQSAVAMQTTLRGGAGADIVVPITVTPADGVSAMDFVFTYDPAVLRPTGAYRTGYTNAFTVTHEFATPGRAAVSASGGPALAGSGRVVWVVFKAIGAAGQFSDLVWTSASLNGGAIASTTTNGKITLINATANCTVPDDAKGVSGTQVTVPIVVTPTDGATSFDITLYFNPNIVSAIQVNATPLTASMTLTTNLNPPGEVRISLFGISPISGSGSVADVVMTVTGAVAGDKSPLDLIRCDLNGRAISSKMDDGTFRVCTVSDVDGDGVTDCAGDCNDLDASVHPGAAERCNGIDDNCDGRIDEGYGVGASCTVGLGVCERGGAIVCTADGLGSVCNVTPGAPQVELCNNLDDDCDGTVDNHITVPVLVTDVVLDTPVHVRWTGLATALSYDVQRGDVGSMVAAGGNFSSPLTVCAANDLNAHEMTDGTVPTLGNAFWYLVRASNCAGNGGFDDPNVVASRNAGIAASPGACP